MTDPVFRINPEGLVHDSIGGEAIVLSMSSGTYYNLSGTAADIWGLLAKGGRLSQFHALLESRYGAQPKMADDVQNFVQTLEDDGLVIRAEDSSEELSGKFDAAAQSWAPPELTAYEDLQDLLTIDPIHDVDDSGWPNAKPG